MVWFVNQLLTTLAAEGVEGEYHEAVAALAEDLIVKAAEGHLDDTNEELLGVRQVLLLVASVFTFCSCSPIGMLSCQR